MDRSLPDDPSGADNDSFRLLLSIRTLDATSSQSSGPVETVKSLRIIIIDADGNLEVNELANLNQPEYEASQFDYYFSRTLNPSDKKLYLIANEESVGEIALTDNSDLPKDIPLNSLTALLDRFKTGAKENGILEGTLMETVLNRIYFENDYADCQSGNAIYLPYSSYYKLSRTDVVPGQPKILYLVPVATKFDFKFTSYREKNVQIKDVILCSANSHNYLYAQLPVGQQIRTFGAESMWWVDWMEKCASNSQTAEDLEEFNSRWGWIDNYGMPVANEQTVETSFNPNAELWKLGALVDKTNPQKLDLGPFYVPESFNIITDEEGENPHQGYTLTFKVRDLPDDGSLPEEDTEEDIYTKVLEGYEIDTLKTLFRGTHVTIIVDLYDKAVEIYAEINPWTMVKFRGFVQENDDDD